jgi:lipopolysaccharide transport system ATP-binding protein
MSEIVIKIENLSKIYRLGEVGTGTLSHDLNRWVRMNILGQDDPYAKVGHVNDRTAPPQPSPKGRGKWKGIIPPMGGTRGPVN